MLSQLAPSLASPCASNVRAFGPLNVILNFCCGNWPSSAGAGHRVAAAGKDVLSVGTWYARGQSRRSDQLSGLVARLGQENPLLHRPMSHWREAGVRKEYAKPADLWPSFRRDLGLQSRQNPVIVSTWGVRHTAPPESFRPRGNVSR